jgi:hypothetical protein
LSIEATAVGVRGEYGGAGRSSELVGGSGPLLCCVDGAGGGLGGSCEACGLIWSGGRGMGVWFCVGFIMVVWERLEDDGKFEKGF